MKVVLIDDDSTFRETLARSLKKRSHEVETVDGYGALKICQEFQPEAVLVDLKMPGKSGLELVVELKQILPNAKLVMLTGYGSIATAMEAVRQGCGDYLTKPANTDQIERALRGEQAPVTLDTPTLSRVEWEHLQRVLADCGNNISEAARQLGIDRRSLQRKLAKYPPER